MLFNSLGSSGLQISRIGFGGAPLGDLTRAGGSREAEETLDAAWAAGIRHFDTAPYYGTGLSERRIGDFLRARPRDEFLVSTKVGRLLVPDAEYGRARYGDSRGMPFRSIFDFSYDAIMRSFEDSLQRLGMDRIDILLLHDIGRAGQGRRHEASFKTAATGGLKALEKLRDSGAVKAIGLGVNETEVCEQALDHVRLDCFLVAGRYTLLEQQAGERFLPRCLKENIGIIAGSVFHTGILATGAVPGAWYGLRPAPQPILDRVSRIEAICRLHDVSLATAAMAFPLTHPAVKSVVVGMSRAKEVAANAPSFLASVPDGLWTDLRAAGLLAA